LRPKKKVKLKDIADALDVSVVTVSNALAGRKGVSETLREEIVNKASAMGYAFSSEEDGEKHIPKKHPKSAGFLIVQDSTATEMPWQNAVAKKALQEGERENIQLHLLHTSKDDLMHGVPAGFAEFSGLIVCGRLPAKLLQNIMRQLQIPVICCGFFDSHERLDFVLDDGFHNMQLVYDLLTQLGHRNIHLVCGSTDVPEIHDHFLGAAFQAAVHRTRDATELPYMPDPKECTISRFIHLAEEEKATAAICTDSESALSLIATLKAKGFSVPADISVTGYSADPAGTRQGLTEIVPDINRIAMLAVKLLSHRINGKAEAAGVWPVSGQLIRGTSAGPVKKGEKTECLKKG